MAVCIKTLHNQYSIQEDKSKGITETEKVVSNSEVVFISTTWRFEPISLVSWPMKSGNLLF